MKGGPERSSSPEESRTNVWSLPVQGSLPRRIKGRKECYFVSTSTINVVRQSDGGKCWDPRSGTDVTPPAKRWRGGQSAVAEKGLTGRLRVGSHSSRKEL